MARGNRALQAALGAIAGGFSGYGADREYRAEQERMAREEERRLADDARRLAREEADNRKEAEALARELAREQRTAGAQGWTPAEQFSGLSPRDMPGATPRQPFAKTTIGDREFVIPESPMAVKHREDVLGAQQESASKRKTLDAAVASAEAAGLSGTKVRAMLNAPPAVQGLIGSRLFPAPEKPDRASRGEREEPIKEETQGMAFLDANRQNPAVISAMSAAIGRNPTASTARLAYQVMR